MCGQLSVIIRVYPTCIKRSVAEPLKFVRDDDDDDDADEIVETSVVTLFATSAELTVGHAYVWVGCIIGDSTFHFLRKETRHSGHASRRGIYMLLYCALNMNVDAPSIYCIKWS